MPTETTAASSIVAFTEDPFQLALVYSYSGHLLRAAARVGLPDAVGDDAPTVAELAARTGTRPELLRRLLHALALLGVFRAREEDRYERTAASDQLREGGLLAQGLTNDGMWRAWGALDEGTRSGDCPFVATHGEGFYDFLARDQQQAAAFHTAMSDDEDRELRGALIDAVELRDASRIVDVGGGLGTQLRAILRQHPNLHGVLFDLESVVADAVPELRSGEPANRCEIIAGDARQEVPAGADVYLLTAVLHNWTDENCVRILSRCAEAARPGARILVSEILIDEVGKSSMEEIMIDLGMFVLFGARERTENDFAYLFQKAGLDYNGSVPVMSSFHLLEARVPARHG